MSYRNPPPLDFCANRLTGKVVIVTGASSGIGEAASSLFAREGATVIAVARRKERIEVLANELTRMGHSATAISCDVDDEASVEWMIEQVIRRYGKVDGAFNNAGISGGRGPIHEADIGDFDRVITTNLRGVFLCLKHEIKAMLESGGGAIVNTSSIGGLIGIAGNSIYSTSKWGLAGLTKCAALDYARQGIRVNAIAPGGTRSEMFDEWISTEEARSRLAETFPMNYIAHPEDMARCALFLLSDESRWTTGTILPCEGGRSVT
jgi:NAD(P)-dependent dehydrogenase (short-subunit alcohol dehydrogenase family)